MEGATLRRWGVGLALAVGLLVVTWVVSGPPVTYLQGFDTNDLWDGPPPGSYERYGGDDVESRAIGGDRGMASWWQLGGMVVGALALVVSAVVTGGGRGRARWRTARRPRGRAAVGADGGTSGAWSGPPPGAPPAAPPAGNGGTVLEAWGRVERELRRAGTALAVSRTPDDLVAAAVQAGAHRSDAATLRDLYVAARYGRRPVAALPGARADAAADAVIAAMRGAGAPGGKSHG